MSEPDVEPLDPADVAWFEAEVARMNALAADADADVEHPRSWPVLFLDIDDVICCNRPFGAHDAHAALHGRHDLPSEWVFETLFDPRAAAVLASIDQACQRQVRYVISSTWRRLFNRSEMRALFRRSGLTFVAERIEPRERWCTAYIPCGTRLDEVAAWLDEHQAGEPFAVLDDRYSGLELQTCHKPAWPSVAWRSVLCEEWVGLRPTHTKKLLRALRTKP